MCGVAFGFRVIGKFFSARDRRILSGRKKRSFPEHVKIARFSKQVGQPFLGRHQDADRPHR
jgi:hypothetical protein